MKRNHRKKKRINGCMFLFILSIAVLLICGVIHKNNEGETIQKGIADQVIRFHVIANSDSEVDQGVKLLVKNKVVIYLQKKLKDVKTKAEAEKIIVKEIPVIQKIAKKTVREEGYDYPCNVRMGDRAFPVKMYGDLTFPAGTYEALQITLGEAEGRNWWCVMFPSLCMVDGTYSIVPDSSKTLLKHVLSPEEYDTVLGRKDIKVKYKFKAAEWWNKLRNRF